MTDFNVIKNFNKNDLFYDFLFERRWLRYITCHATVSSPLYLSILQRIYIGIVYVLLACLEVMAISAFCYSLDNTETAIFALHASVVIMIISQYMTSAIYNHKQLEMASELIRTGVFRYEDEPPVREHFEIRKRGIESARRIGNGYTFLIFISGGVLTTLMPIVKYFTLTGDHSEDMVNPYLSQPFVWPFDTYATKGYIFANTMNIFYMFYLCSIVSTVVDTNLSCSIQLRDQFKILNHSLVNLETRAMQIFGKTSGHNVEELYEINEFQDCIYACLRKNIFHHKALIRMKNTFQNYTGLIFFSVVYMQSLILAANICLLLEEPTMDAVIGFSGTLIVEAYMAYVLSYCGEEIRTESGNTFLALYSTPWVSCDERIKKQILYLMIHCREQVSIKTPGLNVVVCLEAFGNVVSAMYSVINLIRKN